MLKVLLAAVFLAPAPAAAARYDPDPDRAALRRTATACHSTVVDATGLALAPEKVPAITAGLDEGLRLARLAADAARSLDAAARARSAELEAAVKDDELGRKLKELAEPVAAERLRWQRMSAEHDELGKKAGGLPDEERKKIRPLLAKAAAALKSADDGLRPLEAAVKSAGEQALAMKAAQHEALRPLGELSANAAGTIEQADALPAPVAEAKSRLGALGLEPREAARSRAWAQFEIVRGVVRLLFEAADRACNRADDFRRRSAAYAEASDAFEKYRRDAGSGPAGVKALLDEARKALDRARERLN